MSALTDEKSVDSSALELIQKIGLDIVDSRFEALRPIGSSFGGSSFVGRDRQDGTKVFMKYLICPRGKFERSKFLMEHDALQHLFYNPHNISPKPVYLYSFPKLVTDVLVTEFIDGENLNSWLERAHLLSVDEKLDVFHRVVFALSRATLSHQHRDAHPGNIILLPDAQTRMGPSFHPINWNPAVKIVDWGESLPVNFGNYDDEPEHNFVLLESAPRAIGGSITSLPPEVFSPSEENPKVGGIYESWGMGLLLDRILTDKQPPRAKSLGQFAEDVKSGALKDWVHERVNSVRNANLPGDLILPRLLQSLLTINPAERMDLLDANWVLLDIRYEKLAIHSSTELERYFSDPRRYKPARRRFFKERELD